MAGIKYVINNELTENAFMTPELIKKCTFSVGSPTPVRVNEEESGQKKAGATAPMQYYQKFTEINYPNGDKSASMIIPNCVMHHDISDYYGKPSIYIGVPMTSFVREMQLKLSTTGNSPLFQDKKIMSDANYWWTRASFSPAAEGKEYVRILGDDDEPEYYGSFAEFFADYPTSAVANITCTLKFKGETEMATPLKGSETWRAGLQISMFTPFDSIEVSAPSTGIGQQSMIGRRDKMKSGLAKFKRQQNGT